jgi:hypothetical protein
MALVSFQDDGLKHETCLLLLFSRWRTVTMTLFFKLRTETLKVILLTRWRTKTKTLVFLILGDKDRET